MQVFHRSLNHFAKISVLGFPVLAGAVGVGLAVFYRSSYATGAFEVLEQPVQFSHQHHVAELGISCRYCHTSVEESAYASIPPTKTCMNCHQHMWVGAEYLAPVRQSYKDEVPLVWNKVHNVPHYVYFNHSAHTNKGVGCTECHGNMGEMQLTWQTKTLLMEWCLECHREPEKYLRPREEIYNLRWDPADENVNTYEYPVDAEGNYDPKGGEMKTLTKQADLGKVLAQKYHVRDTMTLTSCSTCHR